MKLDTSTYIMYYKASVIVAETLVMQTLQIPA